MFFRNTRYAQRSGFTLIEIMIVVVIVGLLATMAAQTFVAVKNVSQANVIANDFRQYRDAFNRFNLQFGTWPDPAAAGVVPEGMEGYMRGFDQASSVSGNWEWVNDGTNVGIAIRAPQTTTTVMERVDKILDDENLSTGVFTALGSDYFLSLDD